MTGIADVGCLPLSKITIGVLQDIGYDVDYSQADCHTLPTAHKPTINRWDDVYYPAYKRCGCSHH